MSEQNSAPAKSGKPGKRRRRRAAGRRLGFLPMLMIYLVAGLAIAMAVVGVIVLPEITRREDEAAPRTETGRKAQEARRQKAEEKHLRNETRNLALIWQGPATQRTFHCKYLDLYFQGPGFQNTGDLPLAELLGLPSDAPERKVWDRCEALYPFVRMMGGWPTGTTPQDNFIVCEGFRLVVTGAGREDVAVTPARADLARGKLSYGVPGKWSLKQDIPSGYAQGMDRLAPLVTRVDDRCIVAGLPRSRKTGKILGRIERVK